MQRIQIVIDETERERIVETVTLQGSSQLHTFRAFGARGSAEWVTLPGCCDAYADHRVREERT